MSECLEDQIVALLGDEHGYVNFSHSGKEYVLEVTVVMSEYIGPKASEINQVG